MIVNPRKHPTELTTTSRIAGIWALLFQRTTIDKSSSIGQAVVVVYAQLVGAAFYLGDVRR